VFYQLLCVSAEAATSYLKKMCEFCTSLLFGRQLDEDVFEIPATHALRTERVANLIVIFLVARLVKAGGVGARGIASIPLFHEKSRAIFDRRDFCWIRKVAFSRNNMQ